MLVIILKINLRIIYRNNYLDNYEERKLVVSPRQFFFHDYIADITYNPKNGTPKSPLCIATKTTKKATQAPRKHATKNRLPTLPTLPTIPPHRTCLIGWDASHWLGCVLLIGIVLWFKTARHVDCQLRMLRNLFVLVFRTVDGF